VTGESCAPNWGRRGRSRAEAIDESTQSRADIIILQYMGKPRKKVRFGQMISLLYAYSMSKSISTITFKYFKEVNLASPITFRTGVRESGH
jgi:hypothetical protein